MTLQRFLKTLGRVLSIAKSTMDSRFRRKEPLEHLSAALGTRPLAVRHHDGDGGRPPSPAVAQVFDRDALRSKRDINLVTLLVNITPTSGAFVHAADISPAREDNSTSSEVELFPVGGVAHTRTTGTALSPDSNGRQAKPLSRQRPAALDVSCVAIDADADGHTGRTTVSMRYCRLLQRVSLLCCWQL